MNNQRISEILNQLLEQTREQVLPTVYSATMLTGLQELQGLTAGIEAQRAFAQQSAPAVPDGWRPQIVQGPRASVFYGGNRDEHLNRHVVVLYADEYEKLLSMLAAAPTAPVAQEPVRELIGYACDRRGALIPDRCGECLCWPAYQDAPPAAEQPDCPPGHELVAIPIDRADRDYMPCGSVVLAAKALDICLAFALCNLDHGGTRRDVKKAQRYVEEILQLLAAERPDTVKVPRKVLENWLDSADERERPRFVHALRALLAGGAE